MTKVGVIGCGYWGPKLARNFHEMAEAELAWVSDLQQDRLDHMQSLYPDAQVTRNHRDVLASDVDAVVIATPVYTHHPLGMEALRAGKHVLIEKPLASTSDQAWELVQTADALGRVLMVGHTFEYNPAVEAVREVVQSGELGDIYYINATRVNLGLFQPDINVVWDLAPHDLSILNYILNAQPTQVSARGNVYVQKEQGIHDIAYLTLVYPKNIMAEVRVSWLDPVKIRRYTIVGSKKMLVYDDIAHAKVVVFDKGVDRPPYSDTLEQFHLSYRHGLETAYPINWSEPLRNECQDFVGAIREGRRPRSDGQAGARVVDILEKAQKSLLNGGMKESIVPWQASFKS
ncbi:MAG TPA: Gfo/Idh/MocA family oxidoreductase [Anaerolineae bacterium]|nr:Gfo/Idh/MocA family oxidoreductase [Anaerolineae bacterium]